MCTIYHQTNQKSGKTNLEQEFTVQKQKEVQKYLFLFLYGYEFRVQFFASLTKWDILD